MIAESTGDVVKLSGHLRTNHGETVQAAIALTLGHHPSGVIVDCSKITDLTEEGAQTFQAAIDFVLEHEDARIIFVGVPKQFQEVMRHVPQVRSQMVVLDTVAQARKSIDLLASDPCSRKLSRLKTDRQILTCLCPASFDRHVLDVTLELVSTHPAKVFLLMPVVVPREHPLQASLPEIEEKAQTFADQAKVILEERQVPYEIRLERTRELSSLVAEMAEEVDAAQVVVGLAANDTKTEEMTNTVRSMFEKVNRPLLFARGKRDSHIPA